VKIIFWWIRTTLTLKK